ncbi:MAG: ABC transporter ATP-binding protein [Deltaproteobacteria bacterium]|nr:ABC transporter ATP-binding protein [Deltaproteobacteria bacterium]
MTGASGDGRPRERDVRLLRRLHPFVRPHAAAFAGALGLLTLSAGAKLLGPYVLKLAIDGPIADGNLTGLAGLAAVFLAAELADGALESAQTVLVRLRGQRILASVRSALFAKAQRLPTAYLDVTPEGRTLARITSDVAALSDLFTSGLLALLGDLVLLTGIVVALFRLDPFLALAAYAVLPALVAVSEIFRRRMRSAFRLVREKTARLTGRLQEFLRGIEVLRLHAAEPWAEAEFDRANVEYRDAFLRSVNLYALFFPLVELISAVALALVLWQGGTGVGAGRLTFGALVAFFEYVQKFFRPVRDLSEKFNVLQASFAALERISEFLDLPEESGGGNRARPLEGDVSFEDVSFSYDGATPVLRHASLAARPGEIVALVGPTGAGKTTLVHLLLGLYRPAEGRIRVDGLDLSEWELARLRGRIALVAQDVFLFDDTLLENIRLGRPWVEREAAEAAARAVGLGPIVSALPLGYDTPVLEEGVLLSAGQRQLVAFARALAGDPRILVLDEATSEVDQQTEAEIERALETLFQGRTCLVVAHRLSTVRRAHRIVVLSRGRVVEQGTHAELLAQGGLYRNLYELQFRRLSDDRTAPTRPNPRD